MIYYYSKELADQLDIGLAKWKRWTREFLPPDPLGGRQSGYARQFNLKDAFRVFLGGCLVSELKFSIPESRQILSDLNAWMKKAGFFRLHPPIDAAAEFDKPFFLIYILKASSLRFAYAIHAVEKAGMPGSVQAERQDETHFPPMTANNCTPVVFGEVEAARVVGISALYMRFLACLKLQ